MKPFNLFNKLKNQFEEVIIDEKKLKDKTIANAFIINNQFQIIKYKQGTNNGSFQLTKINDKNKNFYMSNDLNLIIKKVSLWK